MEKDSHHAMSNATTVVEYFHERFNAGAADDVLAMADRDITVGSSRGSGAGRQLLEEWVRRATTTLTPTRWFARDNVVVIEEYVEWRSRASGAVTDRTWWGMSFTVDGDRLTKIARYAGIGEAVTKSGLDETDEIRERTVHT